MTALLCPPPSNSPRPHFASPAVIRRAVEHNLEAIVAWSIRQGYPEDTAWIIEAVTEAFVEANGDNERAVRLMELHHRWRSDLSLKWHFQVVNKNLPKILALEVAAWVVKSGIRFPGVAGDLVVYLDQNVQRKGRVTKVFSSAASALVEPESGTKGLVYAEQIVSNMTNSKATTRALRQLVLP